MSGNNYRRVARFGRSGLKASGVPYEHTVVAEAIDALRKLGFTAWRNNNKATENVKKIGAFKVITGYRKNSLMLPGVADIIAIKRKKLSSIIARTSRPDAEGNTDMQIEIPQTYSGTFYLEAKAEDGKQSDEQKEFQRIVEAGGEVYILFSKLNELIDQMKAKGVL